MHVDMDAFYASVEMRRRPELREVPAYVGGGPRGVVLCANYPARSFGVSSGISAARAERLCPGIVAIRPDFETYEQVSRSIRSLLFTVTDRAEMVSIDEAYLDVTGAVLRLGSPREIGERIRRRIAAEQAITCSIGIGPTKLVAKVASTKAKPDGLAEVAPGEVAAFLHPLRVGELWGIGPATASKLESLGIRTVAQLASTPVETLRCAFGANVGERLADAAWGRDHARVSVHVPERSVGSQTTLKQDTCSEDVLRVELLRMCMKASARMRAMGACGRSVEVNLRMANFSERRSSVQLVSPSDVTDEIYAAARRACARLWRGGQVRRVGVRICGLVDAGQVSIQPTLDAPERGMREVEKACDAIVARFGSGVLGRASLAGT